MNLEMQVCSLELAKRLNELGIRQESLFWHCQYKKENHHSFIEYGKPLKRYVTAAGTGLHEDYDFDYYSAFTVSELLDQLPPEIYFQGIPCRLHITKAVTELGWYIQYKKIYGDRSFIAITKFYESLPDALATMLIFLINGNLMRESK